MRITHDEFLGGQLTIRQPASGYRAGIDPVLLAAACPVKPGQSVLELGVGTGVAALCLARRVPGVEVTGVELQPDYAALAAGNAETNALPLNVITADIRHLPADLRAQSFDHVISNPPYFLSGQGTGQADPGKEAAFASAGELSEWPLIARRRLKPGGRLTMIQRMERLPELLSAMQGFGGVTVLPIAARDGRAAERVLLHGRKGSRAEFRLLAPLIIHHGTAHDGDRESYRDEISAVLRQGMALDVDW